MSEESLPIEAVFAFSQEKEVEIHKIELQLTSRKFPSQVEILEGTYTLRLLMDPGPMEMEVSVNPDQTLQLHLKKDNQTWKIQEK